jgi:hypothetical protein
VEGLLANGAFLEILCVSILPTLHTKIRQFDGAVLSGYHHLPLSHTIIWIAITHSDLCALILKQVLKVLCRLEHTSEHRSIVVVVFKGIGKQELHIGCKCVCVIVHTASRRVAEFFINVEQAYGGFDDLVVVRKCAPIDGVNEWP